MYLYKTYTQKHALLCIFVYTDVIVLILIPRVQMAAQTGAFASLVLPSTINCVWGEIEYVLHSADMVVADIAEISCVSAWVAFLTVVNSPYPNVSWRVLINIALITKVTIETKPLEHW